MAEININKEWIREAVQPVIDDVKANYIPKSVIEDIRAEIAEKRQDYLEMNDIDWLNGCDYVLAVIDKHIKAVEE